MHDKYKKASRAKRPDDRLRLQIAREAARRLTTGRESPDTDWLEALTESELYTAKRKAAAVLGHTVPAGRPTER